MNRRESVGAGVRTFLAVRPGEGRLVALVAGMFAILEASRGLAEITGDTLFVARYGAQNLPYLYIGLGVVSLVVALGYGVGVGALPRRLFLPGLPIAFAIIVCAERLALLSDALIVLPIVWLTAETMSTILGTLEWTIAGTTLTARQAKRLFPLCTSAAIVGAFAGTVLAGPLAALIGVENLFLVVAGLLVGAAFLARELAASAVRARSSGPGLTLAGQLKAGFAYTRQSRLMRLVAGSYVLFSILFFSVSFPFLRALRTEYPSEVELAGVLGLVSAAVTLTAFVVSLAIANRVFARFGVAAAAMLLPIVYLAGFGVWLVVFTVPTAIAFRFVQQVSQRGISNAAWGALYNVVPVERRPQVLAFMDGVPGQIGTALSGILLLGAGAVLAPNQVYVLGFGTAVVLVWVVLQIRRRYGDELLASLRAGLAEQVLEGGPGLARLERDPQLFVELDRALEDPHASARRLAADLLGRIGGEQAPPRLARLARDVDPDVRAAALEAIGHVGGERGLADVAAALRDPAPVVRAAAVRVLDARAGMPSGEISAELTRDPSPVVRSEVAVALAGGTDLDAARDIVVELLASESVDDRLAALHAVARRPACGEDSIVRAALRDRDPRVRGAALAALLAIAGPHAVPPEVLDALDDDAAAVRSAATRALRGRSAAIGPLLAVLRSGSSRAQDAALGAFPMATAGAAASAASASSEAGAGAAMARAPGADAPMSGRRSANPALDGLRGWALQHLDRAYALRHSAAAVRSIMDPGGDRSDSGTLDFLVAVLARREADVESRLVRAISMLGAREAADAIRRCLGSRDPDVRGQALEALDAIGDRQLAGRLVHLLEADVSASSVGGDPLAELGADPDVWIRAIALRALAERIERERTALVALATANPSPIVDAALAGMLPEGGGIPVPTTERTLNELDRMLFLRRVPLFAQLAPEDLQRIAWSATERLYPEGEELVREGDVGDHLVVIVEGGVRVVQRDGNETRLIRTYSAGDHIGELAVLTDRPRAATVLADGGSVRGLVIEGAALRAMLAERPEAAMAMLATLAERLASQ